MTQTIGRGPLLSSLVVFLLWTTPGYGSSETGPSTPCTVFTDVQLHLPSGMQEKGHLVIQGERIAALGASVEGLDVQGQTASFQGTICALKTSPTGVLTPGFIETHSSLGLVEVGLEAATRDHSWERADPVRAAMKVSDAFNPNSTLIPIARAGGITSAIIAPGGGLIGGQGAAIDLRGGSQEQAVIRPSVAVYGAMRFAGSKAAGLAALRSLFEDVRLFAKAPTALDRNQTRDLGPSPADLRALLPVVRREIPLVIGADRASDIEALIRFAAEEKIRLVIRGGAEAWRLANELAAAKIAVLIDPLVYGAGGFDQIHGRADNGALLAAADVPVIISSGSSHFARVLRFLAGNAVRGGMDHGAAIQAITETPARVFGLPNRGRLEKGALANLVLWSGDPLEISTSIDAIFIGGEEQSLENRQTELRRKYRKLPGTPSPALPLP